uniref:Golgi associated RAB2 interactor protein-like Rab2B-binding domain-containing protein n=1 Tax=Erpetoichthys calabaricus TaxID=27687 RepID=A0A8C4TID8_ERPCA
FTRPHLKASPDSNIIHPHTRFSRAPVVPCSLITPPSLSSSTLAPNRMCLMDQIPSECPVLTVSNTRLGLTAAAFKLTCNGLLRKFLRRQRLCPICDQFIFESSFVEFAESSQVSRLLDRRTVITVGITSSDPKLLQRHPLLALESVKLYVVSAEWQQLRVEVLNGPVYHLQLLAPEGLERLVFSMWVELLRRARYKISRSILPFLSILLYRVAYLL